MDLIRTELKTLEAAHGVRILYACESGSRAWGFPSPDSDYDVRFFFVHPPAAYLSITDRADSLNLPIDDRLDFSGWDLRKTLQLIWRSNATPGEWLQSPMVYTEQEGFRESLLPLARAYANPYGLVAHYLGLARSSLQRIAEQGAAQKLKTWFYVLRPLLAARWICDQRGIPPMTLEALLPVLAERPEAVESIRQLVEFKRGVDETHIFDAPAWLRDLSSELEGTIKSDREQVPREPRPPTDALDAFFREWVES